VTLVLLGHINYNARQRLLALPGGAFLLYISKDFDSRLGVLLKAVQANFYFNELYNYVAMLHFKYYYDGLFLNIDKGVLELFGPEGVAYYYQLVAQYAMRVYTQGLYYQLAGVYAAILTYFVLLDFIV